MPLSFSSNGVARFSAVTVLDWDNITGKPDIIEFPALSTDNAIARFNDVGGDIQNSSVTVDDSGNIATPGYVDLTEISAPSSPSANVARLYAKDDGAGTTRLVYKNSGGAEVPMGGRTILSANTTYTVGASGTYATLAAAYEYVQENVDTAGFNVIFSLTDSSTVEAAVPIGPLFGGGIVILQSGSGDRVLTRSTTGYIIELKEGAKLHLGDGVEFTHTGGSGAAIFARSLSLLRIAGNCKFSGGAGTIDIAADSGSEIVKSASYRVANTGLRHISLSSGSCLKTDAASVAVTFSGSAERTECYIYAHAGAQLCFRSDETTSGTLTGPAYLIEDGGHIFVDGSTVLPGTVAGTKRRGSTYNGQFGSEIFNLNATYSLPAGPTGTMGQFANADSTNTVVLSDAFAALNVFAGRRANGTAASPSALNAANLAITTFGAYGYHSGGAYTTSAQADVAMFTDESWTNTARGSHMRLRATPTSSTTLTEIARVTGAGLFAALDGSAAAPSLGFLTQTTTGVYYTANTYNIATQGVLRASISSAGLVLSVPLAPASGGIGVAAAACYLGASANLDMNVTTDQALTVTLPSGYTRYKILQILVYEPSISLTTAAGGIYTSAAKGGVQIVASSQTYAALTATGPDVLASALVLAATNSNTIFLSDTTLFFSLTTPQGAAATAKIAVYVMPVP